ncbi:hypothetical protein Peur_051015 [Populus x canadensis]
MKSESIVQKRNNELIRWDPPTSDKVDDSKADLVFRPFKDDLELQIPENEEHGWNGKYEHSPIRISASCLYIYIKMTRMGKVQVIVTISESRTTHIIRGSYQLQSSTGKAHLAEESKFR